MIWRTSCGEIWLFYTVQRGELRLIWKLKKNRLWFNSIKIFLKFKPFQRWNEWAALQAMRSLSFKHRQRDLDVERYVVEILGIFQTWDFVHHSLKHLMYFQKFKIVQEITVTWITGNRNKWEDWFKNENNLDQRGYVKSF